MTYQYPDLLTYRPTNTQTYQYTDLSYNLLILGERFKKIEFYDVNSMYASTFDKPFPCGRGFEWFLERNGRFTKKLMTKQKISIESIEWLDYMGNDDRLINRA